MILFEQAKAALISFLQVGGPVVAILLAMSVLAGAVTIYKLGQFHKSGVGRHTAITEALILWDHDSKADALAKLQQSPNHLASLLSDAMGTSKEQVKTAALAQRLEAHAEARLAKLESAFRLLDSIAQLSPLLGLFGTVLGMIEAFQQLQGAGSSVDPSLLAGGIWVALMTTAVGLAVAMPTSLLLTWFESRVGQERILADEALQTILCPGAFVARENAISPHKTLPSKGPIHAG